MLENASLGFVFIVFLILLFAIIIKSFSVVFLWLDKYDVNQRWFLYEMISGCVGLLILFALACIRDRDRLDNAEIWFTILASSSIIEVVYSLSFAFYNHASRRFCAFIDAFIFLLFVPYWNYLSANLYMTFFMAASSLLFIRNLLVYFTVYHRIKGEASVVSLKETMDKMEEGLLFGDTFVAYINPSMSSLLQAIGIKPNGSTRKIFESIANKSQRIGNNEVYVVINDRDYIVGYLPLKKTHEIQIYAVDVTEESHLNAILTSKQAQLKDENIALKDMLKKIDAISYETERFQMKHRLHDILGQKLSMIQWYLDNNYLEKGNIEEFRHILSDIEDDENNAMFVDNVAKDSLIKSFELVGLKIAFSGTFLRIE